MYFLITLICLVALFVTKDLTFIIAAGLFAIADAVDDSIKGKIRKDN